VQTGRDERRRYGQHSTTAVPVLIHSAAVTRPLGALRTAAVPKSWDLGQWGTATASSASMPRSLSSLKHESSVRQDRGKSDQDSVRPGQC
jgi:hypothetical protein